MSAKEKFITKYRVASINLSCKRVNKHKEGDSKVRFSSACSLYKITRGKRTKETNETFLTLNKSRSCFLIVCFIEGFYLRYLNVILSSEAFFHRSLYNVNIVF